MTFYVENETETSFSFSVEEIVETVGKGILEAENCPDAQVNVLFTDNERIRKFNYKFREIDLATDVLSFPNLDYDVLQNYIGDLAGRAGLETDAGDLNGAPDNDPDTGMEEFRGVLDCDPDTGELILGDIIVSVDKVKEQAILYGHSEKRELAFLVAHGMLHLCGYDHMSEQEARTMEEKQETVLADLGITRT